MTYTELELEIERVAQEFVAQEGGHFHIGGVVSLQQAVEANGYPVVHLDPIAAAGDGVTKFNKGIEVVRVTLCFFEQGAKDYTHKELQPIFQRQQIRARQFLLLLEEEADIGEITDVSNGKDNGYTSQVLAGFFVQFTLKVPISLC